ncbi:RCC1/BLIP-II, partial [Ganoderma leucocontextum]
LALLRDDAGRTELWGCGDGSRGQLGPSWAGETEVNAAVFRPLNLRLGENGITPSPPGEYAMDLIAAGWETSYVVLSCPNRSDILLSFGANDFGNLGIGSTSAASKLNSTTKHRVHVVDLRRALDTSTPTSIITVLSLSTGPHHVLAQIRLRKPDGSSLIYLTGWGASRHGQLGPILDSSGRPLPTCPSPVLIPCAAPSDCNAAPALGTQHTVYMRASGVLVGLGSNRKRQLEGLAALADVAQVACTWNGTYALLRDGRVVATGSNTHAQLGRGPATSAAGSGGGGLEPVAFPFSAKTHRVAKLVCGSEHALCLADVSVSSREGEERKEREVWGWGWNEHGNLGIGGTADSNVPVRIWPPLTARAHPDGNDMARSGEGGGTGSYGDVLDIWAGCGTSWILIQK